MRWDRPIWYGRKGPHTVPDEEQWGQKQTTQCTLWKDQFCAFFGIFSSLDKKKCSKTYLDPGILTIQENHCETSPNSTFFKFSSTVAPSCSSQLATFPKCYLFGSTPINSAARAHYIALCVRTEKVSAKVNQSHINGEGIKQREDPIFQKSFISRKRSVNSFDLLASVGGFQLLLDNLWSCEGKKKMFHLLIFGFIW